MALDQSNPDRAITTAALLKVNNDTGNGYLRSYLPFMYDFLSGHDAGPIASKRAQAYFRDTYGIGLPLGVIKMLLRCAYEDGKIKYKQRIYVADPEAVSDCSLAASRATTLREINGLAESLAQFASDKHDQVWTNEHALKCLLEYATTFSSDLLNTAIKGAPLPQSAPHDIESDAYIIRRFVDHAIQSDQDDFDAIVGLVKGRMLSDALYLDVAIRVEESLNDLTVYLDGPVLLFVLGYAGSDIQAPYQEMIEILNQNGANVRCFRHSVVEAQQILDAAAQRVMTGNSQEEFHGDVVAYLLRSDRTRSDIELLSQHLRSDLDDLGIVEDDVPDRIPELEPDESRLEELLKERFPFQNAGARKRDIDSLTAIHRIRRGREMRSIGSCVAIMATHNFALFQVATRFFGTNQGRNVPTCVYDSSLTTLVWLHSPREAPGLPRERIIADVAAALTPSDKLWHAYNNEIAKLKVAGALSDDDIRFLRYSSDARSMLMDQTLGRADALTEGTIPELLQVYHQRAEGEAGARADDATRENDEWVKNTENLADWIANWSVRIFQYLFVPAFLAGLVLGPVGPLDLDLVPAWLQITCVALTTVTVALFAYNGGSIRKMLEWMRRGLSDHLRRLILGRLKPESTDSQRPPSDHN